MENTINNKKYCVGCGKEIHSSAISCPHCGARSSTKEIKSKTTAGWFAMLIGGLGGHKFYLGQPGLGLLYILFFWTYIPAIIAFFEAIMFWTMSQEEFDREYNK